MKCAVKAIWMVVAAISLAASAMAANAEGMTLVSEQVTNGETFKNQQIYNQWGCTGKNTSPELKWDNIPKGTKSFAVTMYDPDAPTGSGWWHWVVINIPGDISSLPLNAGAKGGQNLPEGASMLRNDFGSRAYGGACPPEHSAPHKYHITVYALDIPTLGVKSSASPAMAGFYILKHTLAKAVLTAPTNAR
ncbi:UPF0098 protein YbcL [Microbulbifer aestuariivivens]|uniref:UPF0098 protein YbcL n=1 Tax=Microbulbifer aestuariivivens TaxID=1908308 RepID=A0ABP9WP35_9GAMM